MQIGGISKRVKKTVLRREACSVDATPGKTSYPYASINVAKRSPSMSADHAALINASISGDAHANPTRKGRASQSRSGRVTPYPASSLVKWGERRLVPNEDIPRSGHDWAVSFLNATLIHGPLALGWRLSVVLGQGRSAGVLAAGDWGDFG